MNIFAFETQCTLVNLQPFQSTRHVGYFKHPQKLATVLLMSQAVSVFSWTLTTSILCRIAQQNKFWTNQIRYLIIPGTTELPITFA